MALRIPDLLVDALRRAVTTAPGDTDPALRQALVERAQVEGPFSAFAEKVRQHGWRVTDEDVQALLDQGLSEDAVFEVTVAAAVGAGQLRLECGLAALRALEQAA